jgi:hypothetical protein
MASGARMASLIILWLANFCVLLMFLIAGGTIFPPLLKLLSGPGFSGPLTASSFQYVFTGFTFFMLITLAAISYKIYQSLAADEVYYPEYY